MDAKLIFPPLAHILGRHMATSRTMLAVVVATTLAGATAAIAAPYLFSVLIDLIGTDSMLTGLVWAFIAYAGLMGLSLTLQRAAAFLTFMSAEALNFIISTSFFERLIEKDPGFFLDHNPTEIESAKSRGTEALNVMVQFLLNALIPGGAQVVLSLVVLGAMLSPDIALIVLAYGSVYIALVYFASKITRQHLDAAVEQSQNSSRFVGNAIGAMDTLRQFNSEGWMIGQFRHRQALALEGWKRYALAHTRFALAFGLALAAQLALTFWLLVPRVASGELTIGALVLFNTLLLQLNMPFQMVGQALQQAAQSYSKFLPFARMWNAPAHPAPDNPTALALESGVVEFDNVGFRYANGRGVEPTSFVARRGTVTYITGDTGSGKSTLFKLLLKAMTQESGTIRIDGIDLASISRKDWFSSVATVPQDIVLLNDSIAINITLGRPQDRERMRRAASRAAILDFIDGLDEGFDTIVGERGLKLSGGERQRIAIARALYDDPAILLLDEASSALDEETEKDIMGGLRAICDQITIIAITHRLSVIGPDDKIVHIGAPVDSVKSGLPL